MKFNSTPPTEEGWYWVAFKCAVIDVDNINHPDPLKEFKVEDRALVAHVSVGENGSWTMLDGHWYDPEGRRPDASLLRIVGWGDQLSDPYPLELV